MLLSIDAQNVSSLNIFTIDDILSNILALQIVQCMKCQVWGVCDATIPYRDDFFLSFIRMEDIKTLSTQKDKTSLYATNVLLHLVKTNTYVYLQDSKNGILCMLHLLKFLQTVEAEKKI